MDIEYQYDVWESFERFLTGEGLLHEFCEQLNFQEALYRENYNKLRFLENHDQPRIASRVTDERTRENYTAMLFLLKGTTLLYAGQEFSCTHQPSLFEREVFPRSGRDARGKRPTLPPRPTTSTRSPCWSASALTATRSASSRCGQRARPSPSTRRTENMRT